jgi:hypothetical protein
MALKISNATKGGVSVLELLYPMPGNKKAKADTAFVPGP